MPASLLSAPDIVAAGKCVETGSTCLAQRSCTSAIVRLVCLKDATYDSGLGRLGGVRGGMEL